MRLQELALVFASLGGVVYMLKFLRAGCAQEALCE